MHIGRYVECKAKCRSGKVPYDDDKMADHAMSGCEEDVPGSMRMISSWIGKSKGLQQIATIFATDVPMGVE